MMFLSDKYACNFGLPFREIGEMDKFGRVNLLSIEFMFTECFLLLFQTYHLFFSSDRFEILKHWRKSLIVSDCLMV